MALCHDVKPHVLIFNISTKPQLFNRGETYITYERNVHTKYTPVELKSDDQISPNLAGNILRTT